jgi:hypothetical protein
LSDFSALSADISDNVGLSFRPDRGAHDEWPGIDLEEFQQGGCRGIPALRSHNVQAGVP